MTDTDRRTEPAPTLRDLIAWRDKAAVHIAVMAPPNVDVRPALDAVHRLYELARRGLDAPTREGTEWAIHNDPVAYAAYSFGLENRRPGITGGRIMRFPPE